MREATTGVPAVIASTTTLAPPSIFDGQSSRCARLIACRVQGWGRGPAQRTRRSAPARSRAACPSAGSSAAPMMVSVTGRSAGSRRHASNTVARILFVAQMGDQHAMQTIGAFRRPRLQRARRLVDDIDLAPEFRGNEIARVLLQHDQPVGIRERRAGVGVAGRNVAIEVGARQHDDERAVRMRGAPGGDRGAAAACVQREKRDSAGARAVGHAARQPLVQSAGNAVRAGAPSVRRCASCRCSRPPHKE